MVIQFGVSNFLSYHDKTVVQFLTNSKETKFTDTDCVGNRFYNCLKYAALFGSNASGKSSFIKAVQFFVSSVKNNSTFRRATNLYCRTRKEHQDEPTTFEMVLVLDDTFYQYGFSVLLKDGSIVDEYLNRVTPSTKATNEIFHRNTRIINLDLGAKAKRDLDFKLEDSIQRNILFLTSIGSLPETSVEYRQDLRVLYDVYNYISSKIIVIDKKSQSQYLFVTNKIDKDFDLLLQRFDFNIEHVKKKKVDVDMLFSSIPNDLVSKIQTRLRGGENDVLNLLLNNKLYSFKLENDRINASHIFFKHFNSESDFEYPEESDGTLRIMDFIPITFLVKDDVTFFIDEIEQSLSSDVVVNFFKILRDNNNNAQILFTTHLDRLFDRNYFRKDEMYIVNKDVNGESHFVRFNQFASNDNINDKFVDGRFGGRPNIF